MSIHLSLYFRPISNHTPRMRMGPSLQRKGPGRVSLPLQAPSRKLSLLSKLTLAPAIRSYSTTAFFTFFISRWQDTKPVISSGYAETLPERGPAKRIPFRTRICPLIPNPTEQGLQSEDIEKERQGVALTDRTLDRERLRTPSVHLHHCLRVVVHHANPSAELQFESGSLQKQSPKTDGQPYRRPWTDLNWSARLPCRLLSPLGPRESSADCPGSIFPSQQRSARGRPDH